jgi:thiamine-phosphate pyrophosphorylase
MVPVVMATQKARKDTENAGKKKFSIPVIYPITDKGLARRNTHLSILRELAGGGASWIQIRDKFTPIPELLNDLRRCVEFADEHGITLIVNDRCDLALSCGAHGIHIGQHDLPPAAARILMGNKRIIGYSASSRAEVRRAADLPVDYIGFGPVFPTGTKLDAAPASGLAALRSATKISAKPIVAIGGIGLENLGAVLNAGAVSAAVVSAIMCAPSIPGALEKFTTEAQRHRENLK